MKMLSNQLLLHSFSFNYFSSLFRLSSNGVGTLGLNVSMASLQCVQSINIFVVDKNAVE